MFNLWLPQDRETVVTGDFDGDAVPDLAVVPAFGGENFETNRGHGDGTFGPNSYTRVSGSPIVSIAAGDVNRDGLDDVVVHYERGLFGRSYFQVWRSDGQGGFLGGIAYPYDDIVLESIVADINGDDFEDLLALRFDPASGIHTLVAGISQSQGNFVGTPSAVVSTPDRLSGLSIADVNHDGLHDVVFRQGDELRVLSLAGIPASGVSTPMTSLGPGRSQLAFGDLDEDGVLDVVVGALGSSSLHVGYGDGTGAFTRLTRLETGLPVLDVKTADINADGRVDVILSTGLDAMAWPGLSESERNRVAFYLSRESGRLEHAGDLPAGENPAKLLVADWDRDGRIDLGVVAIGSRTLTPLLNEFQPEFQTNSQAVSIDLDGVVTDGCRPSVVSKCRGELMTWNFGGHAGIPSETALTLAPLVPGSHPTATSIAGAQVLNIDVTHPSLVFLNSSSSAPRFAPLTPGALAFHAPLSPITWAAQSLALDYSSPHVFVASQAVEVRVGSESLTATTIVLADDDTVRMGLGDCTGLAGSVPFYGSVYSELFVNSNGTVSFGAGSVDPSPSPSEALARDPFVGFWTNLVPSPTGTVELRRGLAGNAFEIAFTDVAYFGGTTQISFSIGFDGGTGAIALDFPSITPNPRLRSRTYVAQFLGISLGNLGATDPGPSDWLNVSSFTPAFGSDMLYDFYFDDTIPPDPNATQLALTLQSSGGASPRVEFIPTMINGQPGYSAVVTR